MNIRISDKHGVNPAVTKCFYCLGDMGVVLAGKLPGDKEAPRDCVWDITPCNKCEEFMKQGAILISVKVGEMEKVDAEHQEHKEKYQHQSPKKIPPFIPNPFRTGGWWVVRDGLITDIISPAELADKILKARFAFIPDDVAESLGLPRD